MIYYNGVSSRDVGLIVEQFPERTYPKRKYSKVSVPGRSGDIVIQQDAWENFAKTYQVALNGRQSGLSITLEAVFSWLNQNGYCRLEDDYDPDVFHLAMYHGGESFESTFDRFGRGTLTFDCKPQAFLKTGEYPKAFQSGISLANPTTFPAKPLIEFTTYRYTNRDVVITVNNKTLTTAHGLANTHVFVDCEEQNVYTSTQSLNGITTGIFPELRPGINNITITNVSEATIVPRWWRV